MADLNLQFEVLKIARDLLMDEYVEQVNQLEQRWAAESALHWRAHQIIIDYPDPPPPPSITDILEKAEMLLAFFNGTTTMWYPEPEPTPEPFPVPTPAPKPEPVPAPTPEPALVPLTEQNVQ